MNLVNKGKNPNMPMADWRGRFLLSPLSVLHSSDIFFANRSACSPNWSCFIWHVKTITPLTASSTVFRSRVSSKMHQCPRALGAAAGILDGQCLASAKKFNEAGIWIRAWGKQHALETLQAEAPVFNGSVGFIWSVAKCHTRIFRLCLFGSPG